MRVLEITLHGTVDGLRGGPAEQSELISSLVINDDNGLAERETVFGLPTALVRRLRIDDHLTVQIIVERDDEE